jgi:hypothetical protein
MISAMIRLLTPQQTLNQPLAQIAEALETAMIYLVPGDGIEPSRPFRGSGF